MATVIENMTGVQIKSPFFSDLKTLELFPDIQKVGHHPSGIGSHCCMELTGVGRVH